MKNIKTLAAIAAFAIGSPLASQAITITLGSPATRTATLGDAQVGYTGSGNAGVGEVLGHTGGNSWTARGDVNNNNGGPGAYINGGLTIVLTSGNWGTRGPIAGTWSINTANFWTTYGDAAISLHVGNGGGEPDHFVWVLTDFATSGAWSYNGTGLQGGGGLSNLKLYSRNAPNAVPGNRVPDGGATVALLGLALGGLGLIRSRLIKA